MEQRQLRSVTDEVEAQLRAAILAGRLAPGSRIDQSRVAEALEVSPVPVREALRRLEAEGLVDFIPQRGAYVSEISLEELEEIYLIRALLEAQATRDAVPALQAADFERLHQLEAEMTAATERLDNARLLELNREFHFTIYQASGRKLLLQHIASLWDKSLRYRHLFTNLPDRAPLALAEHRAILAACETRNPEGAAAAVAFNVRRTTEALIELYRRNGSAPA